LGGTAASLDSAADIPFQIVNEPETRHPSRKGAAGSLLQCIRISSRFVTETASPWATTAAASRDEPLASNGERFAGRRSVAARTSEPLASRGEPFARSRSASAGRGEPPAVAGKTSIGAGETFATAGLNVFAAGVV
jgi:hypothetical protein